MPLLLSPFHQLFCWGIAHKVVLSHRTATYATNGAIQSKAARIEGCFCLFNAFHRVNVQVRTEPLTSMLRDPRLNDFRHQNRVS